MHFLPEQAESSGLGESPRAHGRRFPRTESTAFRLFSHERGWCCEGLSDGQASTRTQCSGERNRGGNRPKLHIEVTETSVSSSDDGIRSAVAKCGNWDHTLRWLEVSEIRELRSEINESRVAHWRAGVKIGFRIDDRTRSQKFGGRT
ncbi:MAG: dodecin domain-containing protein [Planctomycetota bacterium]|nr:MAG: dodecin domain-containing protein [Planctomycetota bacterium]REJ87707.1 MAG: dodecin domain-containing protein [Planctomycetota bacterium]REK27896.1 MAG: dodecin domain-containing protein [Planctomycetota bacterium]REK34416.1 MAG: dodecin domain-containing protein [Planctomycetota bacterium]